MKRNKFSDEQGKWHLLYTSESEVEFYQLKEEKTAFVSYFRPI